MKATKITSLMTIMTMKIIAVLLSLVDLMAIVGENKEAIVKNTKARSKKRKAKPTNTKQ